MFLYSRRLQSLLLLCSFLLLHASAAAQAPPAKAVSPAKKSAAPNLAALFKQHWIDRVKLFRDENKLLPKGNAAPKNVILLGDSITEGFNVKKFFPDRHVLN